MRFHRKMAGIAVVLCLCMLLGCDAMRVVSSAPQGESGIASLPGQAPSTIADSWIPYRNASAEVPVPPLLPESVGIWTGEAQTGLWADRNIRALGLVGSMFYFSDYPSIESVDMVSGTAVNWGNSTVNTKYGTFDRAYFPSGSAKVEMYLDEKGEQRAGVVYFNALEKTIEYTPFDWYGRQMEAAMGIYCAAVDERRMVYEYQRLQEIPEEKTQCLEIFDVVTKERTLLCEMEMKPSHLIGTNLYENRWLVACNGEYIAWKREIYRTPTDEITANSVSREESYLDIYDLEGNFLQSVALYGEGTPNVSAPALYWVGDWLFFVNYDVMRVFELSGNTLIEQDIGPVGSQGMTYTIGGRTCRAQLRSPNLSGEFNEETFPYLYFYSPWVLYIWDVKEEQMYHLALADFSDESDDAQSIYKLHADSSGNLLVMYERDLDNQRVTRCYRYLEAGEVLDHMRACAF